MLAATAHRYSSRLGYAAVAALIVHFAMTGAATQALFVLGLGPVVLVCGDKIVRPVVARDGIRLRFVWVLMNSSRSRARLFTSLPRNLRVSLRHCVG